MKYAIYGAGSLGLVISAILKENGEDVVLVDRNPKNINIINEKGIKVIGELTLTSKVRAILDTEVNDKYDIIFLLSKQIDNINTIKKVANFLNADGVICTMQNGLPEKDVASIIGEDRTFGAAVNFGATRLEYGVSELTSHATRESLTFSLGSLKNLKNEYFDEIKRILEIIGNVAVEDNFIGARLSKLLINSSFSGMSTVCGDTFGNVAKNKQSRKVVQAIIKECIDVAKANNIKIELVQGKDIVKLLDYKTKLKKKFANIIIPIAIKKHAGLKASMLQDIEKGMPCEIDSINQIIVNLANEANIRAPFNQKVVEIVKKLETKELVPSYDNLKYFNDLF